MNYRNKIGSLVLSLTQHFPHRKVTLPYPRNPSVWISFYPDTEIGLWLGYNEPKIISAWNKAVEPGDVVFDLGAHIGIYSLLALTVQETRVHAFEPYPESAQRIEDHGHLNGVTSRLTVTEAAADDFDGETTLYINDADRQNSLYADNQPKESMEVQATQLDTYCRRRDVFPDIVKVDVEGAGGDVLDGATELINQIDTTWLFEQHNESEQAAMERHFPTNTYEWLHIDDRHTIIRPR